MRTVTGTFDAILRLTMVGWNELYGSFCQWGEMNLVVDVSVMLQPFPNSETEIRYVGIGT